MLSERLFMFMWLKTHLSIHFHWRALCWRCFVCSREIDTWGYRGKTYQNLAKSFPRLKQRCLRKASVASVTKKKPTHFFPPCTTSIWCESASSIQASRGRKDANKEQSLVYWWQNSSLYIKIASNKMFGKILSVKLTQIFCCCCYRLKLDFKKMCISFKANF